MKVILEDVVLVTLSFTEVSAVVAKQQTTRQLDYPHSLSRNNNPGENTVVHKHGIKFGMRHKLGKNGLLVAMGDALSGLTTGDVKVVVALVVDGDVTVTVVETTS